MAQYYKRFLVAPDSKVRLSDVDADYTGTYQGHKSAQQAQEQTTVRLRQLQELLYAEHKQSLLICLQARDAGGKDGVIAHAFAAMEPARLPRALLQAAKQRRTRP